MTQFDKVMWNDYAQELEFCGNALLDAIQHKGEPGVVADFWKFFPDFDDKAVAEAVANCKSYAEHVEMCGVWGTDPILEISKDFETLFGANPAAIPSEHYYVDDDNDVVADMQEEFKKAQVPFHDATGQLADHMGVELILASVYAMRAAQGDIKAPEQFDVYADRHPRAWIDALCTNAYKAAPKSYYYNVLALAQALLKLKR